MKWKCSSVDFAYYGSHSGAAPVADARETAEKGKGWCLPTFIVIKSGRKDTDLTIAYYRYGVIKEEIE